MTLSLTSAWSQAKRIGVIVADGFNADEYWRPYTIWRLAGVEIVNYSPTGGTIKSGNSNAPSIEQTLPISQFKNSDIDVLFIPGGKSPENLIKAKKAIETVQAFAKTGKLTSAICHGPAVLAKAGLLEGLPSAYLFSAEKLAERKTELGIYHDHAVTKAGNMIMSRYPEDAEKFALAVLANLGYQAPAANSETVIISGSYKFPLSKYALTSLLKGTTNTSKEEAKNSFNNSKLIIRTITISGLQNLEKAIQDSIKKYRCQNNERYLFITDQPIPNRTRLALETKSHQLTSDQEVINKLIELEQKASLERKTLIRLAPNYDKAPLSIGKPVLIAIGEQFDYTELHTLTQSLIATGHQPEWIGVSKTKVTATNKLILNFENTLQTNTNKSKQSIFLIGDNSSLQDSNIVQEIKKFRQITYVGRAIKFIPSNENQLIVSAPEQMKWSLPKHLKYNDQPYTIGKTIHTVASADKVGFYLKSLALSESKTQLRTTRYSLGKRSSITTIQTEYQDGISQINLAGQELKNAASVMHPVLFKYNEQGQAFASINMRLCAVDLSDDTLKLTMSYRWLKESWHPSIEPDHHEVEPFTAEINLSQLSNETRDQLIKLKALDSIRNALHIDYEHNYRKNEAFLKSYNKQLNLVKELLKKENSLIGFRRDAHAQISPARASLPYLHHEYEGLNQSVDESMISENTDTLTWFFVVNEKQGKAKLSHHVLTSKPVNIIRFMGTIELGGHIDQVKLVNFRYRGIGQIEEHFTKGSHSFSTADIWPAPFNRKIWQQLNWYGSGPKATFIKQRNEANMITMPRGHGVSSFDFQAKGDHAVITRRAVATGNFRSLTEVYPGDSMICQVDDEYFDLGSGSQSIPIIYELIHEKNIGINSHQWRTLWYKTDQDFRRNLVGGLTQSIPTVGFNWDFYKAGQSYTRAAKQLSAHVSKLNDAGVKMVLNHNAGWLNGQGARHGLDGQDTSVYVGNGTCNIYDYKPLPAITNTWNELQSNFRKHDIKYLIWITAMVERFGPMGKEVGLGPENWAMFSPTKPNDVYEVRMGKFSLYNPKLKSVFTQRLNALDQTIGYDGIWLDSWHNLWHSSYDWATKKPRPMNQAWDTYFKPLQQKGKILMAEGHTQHGLSCSIETAQWENQPWYFGHTTKWLRNGEHKKYSKDSLNKLAFKLMACGGWLAFDILEYNTEGPYGLPDSIVPEFSKLAAVHSQFALKRASLKFLPDDAGVIWLDNKGNEIIRLLFNGHKAPHRKLIYQYGTFLIDAPGPDKLVK